MSAELRAAFAPTTQEAAPQTHPGLRQRLGAFWRAKSFSPAGFVRRALFLSIFFAAAHVFGLKEFTSVLNGTTGSVALGWTTSAILGLSYVLLYLGFVLLTPVFMIAAGLLLIWQRAIQKTNP
jgi:hypothetical protein